MNEKSLVLQKINILNELYLDRKNPARGSSEKVLEQMESLLMDYLKDYPQDTDMWLKLTMVEFTPPWEDYDRIKKYIAAILEYDKNNIQALLVLAYAQYIYRGEVFEDLFIRLQRVCNLTTDKELLSMIYSAIAWHYSSYSVRDEKQYELSLLKSVYYCSEHVDNYRLLGRLYLEAGREVEGRKMIQHALANVRKVYEINKDSVYDITDINRFFNEFFIGTYITQSKLESLRKLLD
jgi:hypothetical protein